MDRNISAIIFYTGSLLAQYSRGGNAGKLFYQIARGFHQRGETKKNHRVLRVTTLPSNNVTTLPSYHATKQQRYHATKQQRYHATFITLTLIFVSS